MYPNSLEVSKLNNDPSCLWYSRKLLALVLVFQCGLEYAGHRQWCFWVVLKYLHWCFLLLNFMLDLLSWQWSLCPTSLWIWIATVFAFCAVFCALVVGGWFLLMEICVFAVSCPYLCIYIAFYCGRLWCSCARETSKTLSSVKDGPTSNNLTRSVDEQHVEITCSLIWSSSSAYSQLAACCRSLVTYCAMDSAYICFMTLNNVCF